VEGVGLHAEAWQLVNLTIQRIVEEKARMAHKKAPCGLDLVPAVTALPAIGGEPSNCDRSLSTW
jgi:hypothetical protein